MQNNRFVLSAMNPFCELKSFAGTWFSHFLNKDLGEEHEEKYSDILEGSW